MVLRLDISQANNDIDYMDQLKLKPHPVAPNAQDLAPLSALLIQIERRRKRSANAYFARSLFHSRQRHFSPSR